MSDQEKFLTRWSRRKRGAVDKDVQAEMPAVGAVDKEAVLNADDNQTAAARSPEADALPAPEFDLTKLPSLESIGANSDITAFLQAGVPSALKHAALRRAWAADPAIRDFVGLAENAWDFTDPEAMPGFGALDPKYDVKKLVAEIFGDAEPPAGMRAPVPASPQPVQLPDESAVNADIPAIGKAAIAEPQEIAVARAEPVLQRDENIAPQYDDSKEGSPSTTKRRHGGAKPE